jgi:hypothetical protein
MPTFGSVIWQRNKVKGIENGAMSIGTRLQFRYRSRA